MDEVWHVICSERAAEGRFCFGGALGMEARGQVGRPNSELDMKRQMERNNPGIVRRFCSAVLTFQSSYTLQTPRRSIDREAQQYSPLCE
jgi:hypothetical protein